MTSHRPAEKRVNTITVACAATGPEVEQDYAPPCRLITLADIEAWCARVRELGAQDDLTPEIGTLTVTLDLS